MFGSEVAIGFAVELLQLAKFLLERHACQQCIDPGLDVLRFLRVGDGRGR
jgi:hypothetical protein